LVGNTFSIFGFDIWILNSLLYIVIIFASAMLAGTTYVIKEIICERYVTKKN